MNEAYMPNPSRAATEFVVQTPRIRIMRMSTSGCGLRDSLRIQTARSKMPTANTITVLAESQPHTGASLTEQDRGKPPGHERRAGPVHAAGDPHRRLRDEPACCNRGGHEQCQRQPERIVDREVLDDRSGEHDPGAAADAEQCRHHSDRPCDPPAWEFVADDPEREREDSAGRTLHDAPDNHHRQRRGER
jgi:hypothetical protein